MHGWANRKTGSSNVSKFHCCIASRLAHPNSTIVQYLNATALQGSTDIFYCNELGLIQIESTAFQPQDRFCPYAGPLSQLPG
jgi:hypothetical protein